MRMIICHFTLQDCYTLVVKVAILRPEQLYCERLYCMGLSLRKANKQIDQLNLTVIE